MDNQAITLRLAEKALRYRYEELSDSAQEIVRQCLLDWFAVTLGALSSSAHVSLLATVLEQGYQGEASVIGRHQKLPAAQAALVNGTTAHALDYDDVNLSISGHASAVLFAATLALGETRKASGSQILSAFVAGYETACRVGVLLNPNHMDRGFHATGTVCSFGAAVSCSHLLGFDAHATAQAMGIAGTQASGVKAMFGTLVKPLHAGLAARNGLESALLVEGGYHTREDVLEARLGFGDTHSADFHWNKALADPPHELHLFNNLFKYDASCYGTHAAIQCVRQIQKATGLQADDVSEVEVIVDRTLDTICNIHVPRTGLEGQFSLRLNTAFALLGIDTSRLSSYTDAQVSDSHVRKMMERIRISLVDEWPAMQAEVVVMDRSGQTSRSLVDAGVPQRDLSLQSQQLRAKFRSLAGEVLTHAEAVQLQEQLHDFASCEDVSTILRLCARASPGS